ncbi:MAG: hypothetical protein J5526_04925 [Bacteroidales bacterium]|nr:hypothetical protein [Bacteroidales bacterium]
MIKAVKELKKEKFASIDHKSGVYIWWFQEDCVNKLLKPIGGGEMSRIQKKIIAGKNYYALYFGIAKDCRQRASWHMAQHHTLPAVRSGFLSTLRRTLSALLNVNMTAAENRVNNFIEENCYWEWSYTNDKKEAEKMEQRELRNNYYPLNIQGNKNVPKEYLSKLKSLRREYKK